VFELNALPTSGNWQRVAQMVPAITAAISSQIADALSCIVG
jgi:hypothetical protein